MSIKGGPSSFELAAGDYQERLRSEQAYFRNISNVYDLPPIFHYWSDQYIRPMTEQFDFVTAEETEA